MKFLPLGETGLLLAAARLLSVGNLVLLLSSCEGVRLLLDLSLPHLMSLPLARGSRHTFTGVCPPPPALPLDGRRLRGADREAAF